MNALITTRALLQSPGPIRSLLVARLYATQTGVGTAGGSAGGSQRPRRKAVTAFNDDGRVAWGDLTAREKVARTAQQSFNFSFIIIGVVLTTGVAYLMYTEVFSPDSKTAHFGGAVEQVKHDSRCTALLGNSKKITAYGEPSWNKWRRARPIASNIKKDQLGVEHLMMHFNVEGPLNKGVVNMHMIKRLSDSEFSYKYLALDVKGHQRIYLENADATADSPAKSKTKFFGVSWR